MRTLNTAMLNAIEDAIKRPEDETHIAEREAQMASSLAGTHNRDRGSRADRDAWLAEYRHRLAQRQLNRLTKCELRRIDQAQREREKRQRETAESMELFGYCIG